MSKIKDRTGQKFNHWTFLSFKELNKYGEAVWLCKCDCGHEKYQVAGNVTSGISRWCWNCSRTQGYRNKETIPTPVWKTIVNNAKQRGKEIEITKEFAYTLYLSQDKKCKISGIPLNFAKSSKDYVDGNQTASLDRINSSIGYIEGNVQWVHKKINIMKNKLNEEEFLQLCKIIVDHHNTNTN